MQLKQLHTSAIPSGELDRWWARPRGVAIVVGAYCLLFLMITGCLSSAFNVDDDLASYATQNLLLNYTPRNPPLYYWILYGLQRIVDPSPFSFALVRYTLLFLFAWTCYAIARRTIADQRLQALSVFAISLLWQLGYHAHRVNTHSDLMIVFIALTALQFVQLQERATAGRYAILGALIACGTLSKFGYLAFLSAMLAGAASLEPYRRVLFDRRIVIAIAVAALPLAAFFVAGTLEHQNYVKAVGQVVLPSARSGMGPTIVMLIIAWVGYVMPFLAVFLLLLWPWRARSIDRSGTPLDDARRFLRNTLIAATIIAFGGVLAAENTNIRDRYFHAFYALITVYAFAEADRRPIDNRRVFAFAVALVAVAGGVAALFAAQRLAPSPLLCDECAQSYPHIQIGRELRARFGPKPTLIAPFDAGQWRINMSAARVIELVGSAPAPSGHNHPCVLVWTEYAGTGLGRKLLEQAAKQAGVRLQDAERIVLSRFAPLNLNNEWRMSFYVLPMPDSSAPCQ